MSPQPASGRFLSQITPLGKDHAIAESEGIRIMTMNGAKELTVRPTIMVGLEVGIDAWKLVSPFVSEKIL